MKKWSVMVLFEDEASRDNAMRFFDAVVARRWAECAFDLSWHPTWSLGPGDEASSASDRACGADIIVFSCSAPRLLNAPVVRWLEESLARRGEREGAFIGLVDSPEHEGYASEKETYFRRLAHEAGMDYWSSVPQQGLVDMSDELDWYAERACQVTTVLDDILRQPPTSEWTSQGVIVPPDVRAL